MLGEMITKSGQEDASGFRRMLIEFLSNQQLDKIAKSLKISDDEVKELYHKYLEVTNESN